MINPTKLRIGNWIFDNDKNYCKVIGFYPFGHSTRCDEPEGCDILIDIYENDGNVKKGYMCESNDCFPIPLSEDILVKAGFEKLLNSAWFNINLPLPKNYTYDGGYICLTYCNGALGIISYPGGGFSICDAAEIILSEKDKGITEDSFQLNIKNYVWPPVSVRYLHQLQNLYFALTGTELPLSL